MNYINEMDVYRDYNKYLIYHLNSNNIEYDYTDNIITIFISKD